MPNFTDEQKQAIFTDDKNLIVVAGAGSGKTRVLVERYLHLLDTNRNWALNSIVAITFTREAALEMRDRVRKSLEAKVQKPENDLDRQHWSNLLGQMDSARIDTIHGLCATILRANAAEAEVDPRFDVLEPVDASALLDDVINATLYALAEDDQLNLASIFTEYDSRDIRSALSNPELLAVELGDYPRDGKLLYQTWQEEWEKDYRDARQVLIAHLERQLNEIDTADVPNNDKLLENLRAFELAWQDFLSENLVVSNEACQNMIGSIKLNVGAANNWGGKEALAEVKERLKLIRQTLVDFQTAYGAALSPLDERAADLLVRWYELLARIQNGYILSKAEKGYLDFNDLEKLTARLLRDKPDVRSRYQGAEFKRLLVDEFQDTNAQQWDIVRHLANLDDDVAMFVVGDPKQSIYAFRGADVSVFEEVQAEITARPNGLRTPLSESFRTHEPLINAFNRLFRTVLTKEIASPVAKYEIAFDGDMAAFRKDAPDPQSQVYRPIELLIQRNYTEKELSINSEERRFWEAYEIAKRLKELKSSKAQIHDKESDSLRDFDYGDVALLFQSTSNITLYEQVFKNEGIPFVTVAGRGYYNRQEVWDMLNLLRALHKPADNLSLAAALRSPMFGFSDEILLALRLLKYEGERKPMPLWEALQQLEIPYLSKQDLARVAFARETLQELKTFAGRVTISELLRQALAKTGYLASLTGLKGGARLRRNVEKLLEIAEESGKITLAEFSYYLNDLSAKEVREGEATLDSSGAVRLMTVHASKGLEFPVVVLVDCGWKMQGGLGALPLIYDDLKSRLACKVFDESEGKLQASYPYAYASRMKSLREDAEKKRLLYVAATRARDCLIISGEVTITKTGMSPKAWMKTLLDALTIESIEGIQDGDSFYYVPDCSVKIWLPDYDGELLKGLRSAEDAPEWKQLAIRDEADLPSLMRKISIAPEAMMGHIAATQLANIGAYHHARFADEKYFYRSNVQRDVLDAAPAQVREAIRTRDPRVRPRQLGEVVHQALQYWRFPSEARIDDILRSYAWQQGITDSHQIEDVVQRARHLLERFQAESDIYTAIETTKAKGLPLYTELPFVFRTEKRIIHGVIDSLFQHENGEWWIVDYKTSTVSGGIPNLENHARRYHLQVGAYASAVQEELGGIIPKVFVYYIQYNRKVEIPNETWQSEILKLEAYLGELIRQS